MKFWRPKPGETATIHIIGVDHSGEPDTTVFHFHRVPKEEGESVPTDMNHERMRWNSMGFTDLERRLRKITIPDKLLNFIQLCGEYWDDPRKRGDRLCHLARDRAVNLGHRYQQQRADALINTHDRDMIRQRQIEEDRNANAVNRPPNRSTQDLLAASARAAEERRAQTFQQIRTATLGLYVRAVHESNFAVLYCSRCHDVVVRVGLSTEESVLRERRAEAVAMIRAHGSVCRVMNPPEPEKPKIRVIRMGGKK